MSVKDRNDCTACRALMAGLRSATVIKYMISVKDDISYLELISEVRRHIQAEKTSDLEASKLSQDFLLGGKCKIDSQAGPYKSEGNGNGNGKKNKAGNGNNRNPNNNNNKNQAPQNNQVPRENEHLGIFTIPPNIRTPVNRCDNTKYCHYHRDIGHITEECRVLKEEIERLIQRDKISRLSNELIIFTEEEASGLWHPHKDAIVASLRIASHKVYKILIDNGSSADILFRSTLNIMNLVGAKFELIKSALYGFTGDSVSSE
ncbi:hypothetical protein UlMin_003072 [Ulmus minor]